MPRRRRRRDRSGPRPVALLCLLALAAGGAGCRYSVRLAARYLGSAADWRLIADDNPGLDTARLAPGTVVAIRRRR